MLRSLKTTATNPNHIIAPPQGANKRHFLKKNAHPPHPITVQWGGSTIQSRQGPVDIPRSLCQAWNPPFCRFHLPRRIVAGLIISRPPLWVRKKFFWVLCFRLQAQQDRFLVPVNEIGSLCSPKLDGGWVDGLILNPSPPQHFQKFLVGPPPFLCNRNVSTTPKASKDT